MDHLCHSGSLKTWCEDTIFVLLIKNPERLLTHGFEHFSIPQRKLFWAWQVPRMHWKVAINHFTVPPIYLDLFTVILLLWWGFFLLFYFSLYVCRMVDSLWALSYTKPFDSQSLIRKTIKVSSRERPSGECYTQGPRVMRTLFVPGSDPKFSDPKSKAFTPAHSVSLWSHPGSCNLQNVWACARRGFNNRVPCCCCLGYVIAVKDYWCHLIPTLFSQAIFPRQNQSPRLCSPAPCNSKVLGNHLQDCSTDGWKGMAWLKLEYDNCGVKQHPPGGLLCALGREKSLQLSGNVQGLCYRCQAYPMISPEPRSSMENNQMLYSVLSAELCGHIWWTKDRSPHREEAIMGNLQKEVSTSEEQPWQGKLGSAMWSEGFRTRDPHSRRYPRNSTGPHHPLLSRESVPLWLKKEETGT